MPDTPKLLDVLRGELEFLEKGGYNHAPRQPWRYQYMLEDSPSCPNYGLASKQYPCDRCVLIDLVPPEHRQHVCPCRDIPLNAEGETLRQLYSYADPQEIERKYAAWLRKVIDALAGLTGQATTSAKRS